MPEPAKSKTKTKKGAWSTAEKEYVERNIGKVPIEEMARHLNRDAGTLARWAERNAAPKPPPPPPKAQEKKRDISTQFRNSLAWKKLKDEFTPDELLYFEEEYIDLFQQFDADVYKTEEQQIRKAITLDILMRRNLAARKKLNADIDRMEAWQERATKDFRRDEADLDPGQRQQRQEFLLNLETQLQALRAAEQSKTKEFSDLDNRHQKLMEALKATREQRVTRLESSKQSFLGVIRELAAEDRTREEGRLMELMRGATDREYRRLAKEHVYDDGNADRPILSAETLTMADEEE